MATTNEHNGTASPPTVPLATYLFTRIRQLGISTIFGVPGDCNLPLLDYVEPSKLSWVGCCNELNAGYAADAYSRVVGAGCLLTTFGVGELSAINAVAGAHVERAPLIHVVGTPPRPSEAARKRVHHLLADADYGRFAEMHRHVTVAQAKLWDAKKCPEQIDRVLLECLRTSRPVYIQLPEDMADVHVPAPSADYPPVVAESPCTPAERRLVTSIVDKIRTCTRPALLVDGEVRPNKIVKEVTDMAKMSEWPTWVTPFGKGLVPETLPNFHGVYQAEYTPLFKEYIDSCDLIFNLGPHHSTTNTAALAAVPDPEVTIAFAEATVTFLGVVHRDVDPKQILRAVLSEVSSRPDTFEKTKGTYRPVDTNGHKASGPHELINQREVWPMFSRLFKPDDAVLTETGTASHGGRYFQLPEKTSFFTAVTWLSIGYMLPATLGAAEGKRDLLKMRSPSEAGDKARAVLFIGDGSLQMTVQEISTMIHRKLNVTIFIINNDGYTIERMIHGVDQAYNGIAPWRYLEAANFFGADRDGEYAPFTAQARSFGELDDVLKHPKLTDGKGLKLVEVFMDKYDAPATLISKLEEQLVGRSDAGRFLKQSS